VFDCNSCGGMCCVNPPLLFDFSEGMKAKKLGVEIVASGDNSGGYLIAIAKKKDVCPFLDVDSGDCKIYDNRFMACKSYSCKLIGKQKSVAVGELLKFEADTLNVGLSTEKPKPLTRSEVRKIGAKIIKSRNKLLQKISATDFDTYSNLVTKTIIKARQVNE